MTLRTADVERLLLTGPKKASELIGALGISQPTFSRWIKKGAEKIRVFGQKKTTLYGLSRPIPPHGDRFPLYRVDETGEIEEIAQITAVYDRGFVMEGIAKSPVSFPGIPYFLSDHRPQGFLGRLFARRNSDLDLPNRITDWTEDQVWRALISRGENIAGNLIVGQASFENALKQRKNPHSIPFADRLDAYARLADETDDGTMPGSSAAGEQPKFTATLRNDSEFRHVIVKYSPRFGSEKARRWKDLLACEWIALEIVAQADGIATAPAEFVIGRDRAFLASSRFDRVGQWGRKGTVSFQAVEAEKIGSPSRWAASAAELLKRRLVSAKDARSIRWLDAFGALIANTDRHYGNLSFHLDSDHLTEQVSFELAPVYDMLPMYFAPREQENDVFPRMFDIPERTADTADVWKSARDAAREFWIRVSKEARISDDFREEAKKIANRF